MRIILVESDWAERDIALNDIRVGLPSAEVTTLKCAGQLLIEVQEGSDLGGADIVVMEHHLPLWTIGESQEELDRPLESLARDFPEVVNLADGQLLSEKLVRYIRSLGIEVPILFYTLSRVGSIAGDILHDPKVYYCNKLLAGAPLVNAIKLAVAGK